MATAMAAPAASVALPAPSGASQTQQQQPTIPFRRATVERDNLIPSDTGTVSASQQTLERQVQGSGYVFGLLLKVNVTTAGNAATVAFTEDAPWNFLARVIYKDVNGELISLDGYALFLTNLANAMYRGRYLDQSSATNLGTVGVGATAGSFQFFVRIQVATNYRDLNGLVGNQDRAQSYTLKNDFAPSATIYATPPTNFGAFTVTKVYQNYSVPMPMAPSGAQQEVYPPNFGVLHFTTATLLETPTGGSTTTHYLKRIGNTVRYVILVWRSNGLRSTADANAPTAIRVKVGEDTIFNEDYSIRRALMFERYGFDWPLGVVIYEALHDFDGYGAGGELGDDYYHTQALVNFQFEVTYPSGFGSTNNTLLAITDDLVYVPPVAQ